MKNSYRIDAATVLAQLNPNPGGLNSEDARNRLQKFGPNQLIQIQRTGPLLKFLGQFKDVMILILMAAAVVSGFMGGLTDTFIILFIVLANAIVGFFQEYRADQAMEALKKLSVPNGRVLRDGMVQEIPSVELVPGDLVLLESGNAVPADLRLVEVFDLRMDESTLTGESQPVTKSAGILEEDNPGIGDQRNMAFKGTHVGHGRGKGVVVATGMDTELGKIARLLQGKEGDTPLKQRMAGFSKNLTYIILLICLVIFVSGRLRGEGLMPMLMLSISLAVAAIPEALPALMTVTLAQGARRMARQNALVRKLASVETLGSVSYICSDKTGTLTQNRMSVTEREERKTLPELESVETSALFLTMVLNQDVRILTDGTVEGESTEKALVENAIAWAGLPKVLETIHHFPRVAEFPFDSERKCMTTVHRWGNRFLVLTKGASDSVAKILADPAEGNWLEARAENRAREGERVLAFAGKLLERQEDWKSPDSVEKNLIPFGLAGIMDPPRPEAKAAIHECKEAGIRLVMITGDHPSTAASIAKEIGLLPEGGQLITGKQLEELDETSFRERVEDIKVYARVSPQQKLRIVYALQSRGHYCAMTGDGVNDAPSLKAANIGVAMGKNGTDVSREAAQLVLLDDNFATLVKAVKEGRRIYDNIRKFVRYIMTCNSAEIWTIFLAPLIGLPIPLLPIHILWINLVTDGLPGLALAAEKGEPDSMKRRPRPVGESLFSGGLGFHIIWVGIFMAGVTLGIQAWTINTGNGHWQTMVFTVLSLSQLGHALAVRSERRFLFRQGIWSNPALFSAVLFTFFLQLGVIYIPFLNPIFSTHPLEFKELLLCIGLAALVFHAVEVEKWIRKSWGTESGKG